MFKCQRCGSNFDDSEHYNLSDEVFEGIPKLCYHCFEDALEEWEEKKRERIARENEY